MTVRRVGPRTFIAVISLGGVGMTLGIQAVAPALPELQRQLGLSDSRIGLVTTAYVLPGVFLAVPLGILGDLVGRRLLFCVALTASGVAAIIEGITTSFPLLLAMRAVQGSCFAAVLPLTITLLGAEFSGPQRIRAFVGRNSFLAAGDVVLPIVGALVVGISWRAPLFMQAVTIPLAILSFMIMDESRTYLGGERHYARDLSRVLRTEPSLSTTLLAQFGRFFFKFVMLGYLPILLVKERDASVTQVGLVISLAAVVTLLTTTRVPAIIRRVRPSAAVLGSFLGIATSIVVFALAPDWRWALAGAAIYGVGDGVLAVLSDMYASHTARSHLRAGMVSVSQTARNLGKLSSPVAVAACVAASSLQVAFLVMAVVGVALAPMMSPLRRLDHELRSSSTTEGQAEMKGVPPGADPLERDRE